ncbi:hypothetical protein E4T56_gene20132 [Termitomyces sp. T112]|nr:hypothetical protein E4T56_gene20132 [Termitomyces sp. T112]
MAPKLKSSPTKNTNIAKDVKSQQKSLMLPPPDPPAPQTILEPEVNALSTCLMNAAIKTGQIYGFHADTRRLGIEHAPKPPHSLTASLGREIEKYDQIVDAMESYLLRAIATLQRDLDREEKRLRSVEEAAIATRTRSKSTSLSPTATRVALPVVPDIDDAYQPAPNAPGPTPTNSPPTSSKIGRRPSAISISSLQRPALPLKLDLSASALHITPEEVSMFSSGLASPVTLAPKSARIGGPNEFHSDLMAAFTSSSQTIDLTMDNDGGDVKMGVENMSGTADRPIELDMEGMDIDMTMTDLFGDPDSGSNDANTMNGLFSPIVIEPDRVTECDKPIKTEEAFLQNIGQTHNEDDIFSTLNVQGDTGDSQQSKNPPSISRSASSPASLLASLTSSQLQGIDQITSDNIAGTEAPFDMSDLDLTNIDQTFFESATDADMNFSMDMDQFMATVQGAGDGEAKKAENS